MKELEEVSARTMEKISDMNSELASSLNPSMPTSENLKWTDVFKNVSITGDEDIPLNKRGSGVRRMVLLNFFRAEVEKVQKSKKYSSVIYAIEEPETAQHVEHQKMMIESLMKLSNEEKVQVIITTHSSNILKRLSANNVRLVKDSSIGKVIEKVSLSTLPYISLNEIAYAYFGDVTYEYHDELYGHIEYMNWLNDYKSGKKQLPYKNLNNKTKAVTDKQLTQTEIIRHQIHHPENDKNTHFTEDELKQSIDSMRSFIIERTSSH